MLGSWAAATATGLLAGLEAGAWGIRWGFAVARRVGGQGREEGTVGGLAWLDGFEA